MERVEGLMRYGIFSDIHSNLEALDTVIEAYRKEVINKYLCVGDVIGYAANPRECIEKVKTLTTVTVAGNHDWAAVDLFSLDYFNPLAKESLLWTKNNLNDSSKYFLQSLQLIYKNENLTLVHGTLNNPQEFNYLFDSYAAFETFRLLQNNVCFVGHTHVAGIFVLDQSNNIHYREDNILNIEPENKYIINVGSVGQPRDEDPRAAYCIYDTEKKVIQIKRIRYAVETTRKKIFENNLPRFLGDRLLVGK